MSSQCAIPRKIFGGMDTVAGARAYKVGAVVMHLGYDFQWIQMAQPTWGKS